MALRLTPRAQSDLEEIWDYSCERWGIDQAEHYAEIIRDALISASQNPRVGRSCDEIRQGYFKLAAGSHMVFYRLSGADIDVVRILHGRMDFNRHL